jgi:hypothetical protein
MLSYKLFLESKMIELINESVIHFTPRFYGILRRIDSEISKDLQSLKSKNIEPDITFLDIDKDGYLSFSSAKNVKALILKKYAQNVADVIDIESDSIPDMLWSIDVEREGSDTGISKRGRSQLKIGKLVNKLFPDKYTDKQIEEFVNKFKANIEKLGEHIEVVEGDDIAYWYNSNNYYSNDQGSLANSCMKSKSKEIFQIYTENKEVCKLVILVENNLLKGRALLWKVDKTKEGFEWFMDRQYTNIDSDVEKFRNYAKQNGWAYKTYNNHNSQEITFDPKIFEVPMSIKVNRPSKDLFPYMDTFKRFDPSSNTLHNDMSQDYMGNYLLVLTDGDYEINEDNVWSDYYGENIPRGEAIYSDPLGDYIYSNEAIEVRIGSPNKRGWYPDGYSYIVYSDYLDQALHKNDAVYSTVYDTHILKTSAENSVNYIREDGFISASEEWVDSEDDNYLQIAFMKSTLWYKWCLKFGPKTSQDRNWSNKNVIHSELFERIPKKVLKPLPENFTPTVFKIDVYQTTDKELEIEYLSKVDAYLLEYSIDKSKRLVIDKIKYNTELFEAGLTEKIKSRIKFLKKQLSLDFEKDEQLEIREQEIQKRISDFMYIFTE